MKVGYGKPKTKQQKEMIVVASNLAVSEWDIQFLDSLAQQTSLTDKQSITLEAVYDRLTSLPEREWLADYGD